MKPTTQQQFVFLFLLFASANAAAVCNGYGGLNWSVIKDMMSAELADTKHQVEQLQGTVLDMQNVIKYRDALPKDCSEILAWGIEASGVYEIQPLDVGRPISVYCDMETDSGGWTVFQRRQDGSVSFDRTFAGYRHGFGNLDGEFWLGNENLHRLTAQDEYELRVDLMDFDNTSLHVVYDTFSVGSAKDTYRLKVGGYVGTIGDSLVNHNGMIFSAKDRDNDNDDDRHCAQVYSGGWWYDSCYWVNLNGIHINDISKNKYLGIKWLGWSHETQFKFSEMKLRAKE